MGKRLLGPLAAVAGAVGLLGGAQVAEAARVLVLTGAGHAVVRHNPYLPPAGPVPKPAPARAAMRPPPTATAARAAQVTIGSTLTKLRARGQITAPTYSSDHAVLQAAIRAAARLQGTRRIELYSVLSNIHRMAASGALTPSRLPALFLTLQNNRRWWSSGPLLAAGQRVQFAGSRLVWEYYPGQGIELQELGSFGEADGFYTGGPADYPKLRQLLSELIPLAARRAGGLAWEYYFDFDGGRPPWASAMAQGTAIEALTRAYEAFHDPSYLNLAAQALPLFRVGPPVGVRIPAPRGARYLQYSFAPGASILNAFLQSLIGLYDYAHISGDQQAQSLFDAGNAEALAEVPRFNTGAWSLYQQGQEDSLSYHELVTGFLQQLCTRTQAGTYCHTAAAFQRDLTTPPVLRLITHHSRVGARTYVYFWLSKESHVGIVEAYHGSTLFATSTELGRGVRALAIPTPRRPGRYTIRLAATDLAGNFSRIAGTVAVAPAG